MVDDWLIFSIVTIVFWGIWGLLSKLVLNYLDWKQFFVISDIGILAVTIIFYLYFRPNLSNINQAGLIFALVVGVIGSIAAIGFYLALTTSKASIVVPLTSLYPVVTVLLSFLILKENITIVQGLGVFLALVAMVLISL
jgi:transporter family protein